MNDVDFHQACFDCQGGSAGSYRLVSLAVSSSTHARAHAGLTGGAGRSEALLLRGFIALFRRSLSSSKAAPTNPRAAGLTHPQQEPLLSNAYSAVNCSPGLLSFSEGNEYKRRDVFFVINRLKAQPAVLVLRAAGCSTSRSLAPSCPLLRHS
ncbi:hypothetical protein SRHO_G00041890 [Serrasalmus rhombeus]